MTDKPVTTPTPERKLIHNVEEHPDDDTLKFCSNCQNSGQVSCYCGGDQCYCENQGDTYCPYCEAGQDWEP